MLRDFQHNPSTFQIVEVLRRFSLDFQSKEPFVDILKFEVISPDSFMWRLLLDDAIYYLYAEDYVPGVDYIKEVFNDYLESDRWDFVIPQQVLPFESSAAVEHTDVYQKSERVDELMKCAVVSGYDFVFLVKTLENPEDAHFNEKPKSKT